MRYLGINVVKKFVRPFTEKAKKTIVMDIIENLVINKSRTFMSGRHKTVKIPIFIKLIYKFNISQNEFLTGFLGGI